MSGKISSRSGILPSTNNNQEQRVWMTLSGDYKKRGSTLMQQQCWCWGFDVRRQKNGVRSNLLLDWGFRRTPPPQPELGATTYQKHEADGSVVTLWGFGVCFGDEHGGIFVSRFAFWPRLGRTFAPQRAYSPKHLEEYVAPRTLNECQAALAYFERTQLWIGEYERRVLAELGEEHRLDAFRGWGHRVPSAQEVPALWDGLAAQSQNVARFWKYENGKKREVESSLCRKYVS